MRASRGLKWENKMYKLKRSIVEKVDRAVKSIPCMTKFVLIGLKRCIMTHPVKSAVHLFNNQGQVRENDLIYQSDVISCLLTVMTSCPRRIILSQKAIREVPYLR